MYPDLQSKSASLYQRARKVLPGGSTRHGVYFAPYPVYQAMGRGCRLTDVDGVERLDFVNNWSSLIHGHCNPAIVAAVTAQASRMMAVGSPTAAEVELAELLCDRLQGVKRICFSNSGSEGVAMAVRAARAYTGRSMIAKAEGAYHGNADVTEVSVSPSRDRWGEATAPASVPATAGIPPGVLQDVLVLPYNDVESTRQLISRHAEQLAAVVIDPVVSRMGFVPASPAYLAMLRDLTRDKGIVLIFDEVFSFRLGYHGAQGQVGVTPDLTALGKIIGGGLPVGATGGSAEIMQVFDLSNGPARVEHVGTYNGNPMTMAAGLACMQQMTPAAYDRLAALGDRARNGLREALKIAGLKGQVLGQGSLLALAFNDRPFRNFREMPIGPAEIKSIIGLHRYLLNHGVQMVPYGLFILSTAMTEADIDFMLEQALAGMREIRNQA